MTKPVATRLISLPEISADHRAAWRRLAERAAEPNPFFEADFVLAAIERTGPRAAQLLVVERGGEWIACAPVRRRGAPPMGALQSLCDEYCFLGTPLVERDSVEIAVEALLGASQERHRLLVLERLALDGPIAATVGELLESRSYQLVLERRSERAAAVHASAGQELELSSKERSERRRRQRRLEDEVGCPVHVRDRSGSPEALEHFLRLEAASWKGKGGTALASRPADEAFFRRVSSAFADAGRLRVLELSADSGAPLAVSCDLVAGDTIFCFKTAFDEDYRRHAPGVELTTANAEDFFANRPERVLDSCSPPDSKLLNKLLPDRRPLATLVIGPRGARTALARGAARAAATMHERRAAARRG
jgi:CelD/BcsL family acetyltransferase involved in cellulose biosynthesis